MRARAVMAVFSLVPVLLSAQQRGQDTRPGIAVFPFANGGSYGQSKEDFDAFLRSDAFKEAVAWGRAEILRGRPRHRIFNENEGH